MFNLKQTLQLDHDIHFVDLYFMQSEEAQERLKNGYTASSEPVAAEPAKGEENIPRWLRFIYAQFLSEKIASWLNEKDFGERWRDYLVEVAEQKGNVLSVDLQVRYKSLDTEDSIRAVLRFNLPPRQHWARVLKLPENELFLLHKKPISTALKIVANYLKQGDLAFFKNSQDLFLQTLRERIRQFLLHGRFTTAPFTQRILEVPFQSEISILPNLVSFYAIPKEKLETNHMWEVGSKLNNPSAYYLAECPHSQTYMVKCQWPDVHESKLEKRAINILTSKEHGTLFDFSWDDLVAEEAIENTNERRLQ